MTDSKLTGPPRQAAPGKARESGDSGSNYNKIPKELTALPQWVCAHANKIPINPKTGRNASVTDPTTWGTYDEAVDAGLPHIGFVFTKDDLYVGIDLDNPIDDDQKKQHQGIYNTVQSYTEVSRSGEGVHIIVKGEIPRNGKGTKRDNVEVYDRERYFIFTGDVIPGRPATIEDYDTIVKGLVEKLRVCTAANDRPDLVEVPSDLTDQEAYEKARSMSKRKFDPLWEGKWQDQYPSQSEADYALMWFIAQSTRSNEQARSLFRQSELGQRDKALREDYLNNMLEVFRAEQEKHQAVDLSSCQLPGPDHE